MAGNPCGAVRRWLQAEAGRPAPAPPPAELAEHIAGCPVCRGALALLGAPAGGAPAGAGLCDRCQEDLAAYVDLELSQGAQAAARRYPQTWWHLLVCADCAEAHRMLLAVSDAVESGELAPLPPGRRPALLPGAVRLARDFLHELFASQRSFGTAWAGDSPPQLIAEDELPGCRIAILVRQPDAAHCELTITVEPPTAGRVVLSFGERRFSAPLAQSRRALFPAIPAALLTDQSGPDMLISIERDADASG